MGRNTTQDYGLVQMTDDRIVSSMTIREAAALWSDPRKELLKRWTETFGVPLQELHPGHVVTYQKDRSEETTSSQVDAEVGALLALLKGIGLGDEIERRNRPLSEAGELTPAEFKALPESARKYIDKLKGEIADLQAQCYQMENRIRRTNWGRSR
ncbi:MAG TPA: hypothetical protein VGG56_09115 [Terracidiphilus sp.]|jgi:hypothetical protein